MSPPTTGVFVTENASRDRLTRLAADGGSCDPEPPRLMTRRQADRITNVMEFSGKLTKEDLDDLAVLLRPKGYWFSFLLETWHGAALFGFIAWATVLAFLGRTSPHWLGVGVIWLVIAGVVIWTAYTVRRDRPRDLARLNAALPDRVQLTTEGIRWAPSSGGLASLPWGELGGWRERGRIIAIDNAGGAAAVFFSVAEMSELERQRLRDFLRSKVPPAPSLQHRLDPTG